MPAALAALIEAVGVEGLLTIALFSTFAAYIVSRGLLVTWTATFGKALLALASVLPNINTHLPRVPHINLKAPFLALNNAIVNYLEAWAQGTEHAMAWTWRAMGSVWRANVAAVEWASHELADSMEWLLKVRLPKWARAAFAVAFPFAYLTKLIADQVRKLVAHPLRTLKVIEHATTRTVVRVVHKTVAVALPGAHAIPGIRKEIVGLTRRNLRLSKRLHRVEALFGATVMTAVLANALGLTVRCVRPGGNLSRLARSACRAPSWFVRFLVAGAVEAFILADLCDFSNLLIAQTEKLRPALMELVDVENALVGCHDFTAPRTFQLPPVSLPALVDAVSLAA